MPLEYQSADAIVPRRLEATWRAGVALAYRRAARGRGAYERAELSRAAAGIEGCRRAAGVEISAGGDAVLQVHHCNVRTCRTCQPHRTAETRQRLADELSDQVRVRRKGLSDYLFTVPGKLPFRLGYAWVSTALRELSRDPEWRARVPGWFTAIEHPWRGDSARWHWHAHVTAESRYWREREICGIHGRCQRCAQTLRTLRRGAREKAGTLAKANWYRARIRTVRQGCGTDVGYKAVWHRACVRVWRGSSHAPPWLAGALGEHPDADPTQIRDASGNPLPVVSDVREARVLRIVREAEDGGEAAVRRAVEEACAYPLKGDAPPPERMVEWQLHGRRIQRYRWGGTWRRRSRPRRESRARVLLASTAAAAVVSGRSRVLELHRPGTCGRTWLCPACDAELAERGWRRWASSASWTAEGTATVAVGCGARRNPERFRVPRRHVARLSERWRLQLEAQAGAIERAELERDARRSRL